MGRKHGPCLHCGIHFTPLWRNGPEDKPVLCNACGSRYRKQGSLKDYLPNHSQQLDNLKTLKSKKYLKRRKNLLVSSYITGRKRRRLWNPKIPSRKRSRVVYKKITPMERFHKQLLMMWKTYGNPNESSPEQVLLSDNVNNFIPSNEIGLGCAIHKHKQDSASA